jgi:pyrroloquinoline quinone (PQQ) biosynthesis protein C
MTALDLQIADVLAGRQLLTHPFYRRWEDGSLKDGELRSYAEQYRHFEFELASFLSSLSASTAHTAAHSLVAANLADEVGPPSHLELFEGFAQHYGAGEVAPSPAMAALVAAYEQLLATPDAALGGLFAYETQGAEIARTKADSLDAHYEATETATRFWRVHEEIEADHAGWTREALASCDEDEVLRGATVIADAWWNFLDEREALAGV